MNENFIKNYEYYKDISLKKYNTYRLDVKCGYLIYPGNTKELIDLLKYLKENLEVSLIYYGEELIGLNLPEKIDYVITSTEQAVKGNTSQGAQKDATLENGMTIKVPLFIGEGESVLVSTKDGKYVSRA